MMTRLRSLRFLCVAAGAHALILCAGAAAQEKPAAVPAAAQKTFATAREAAEALVVGVGELRRAGHEGDPRAGR